MGIDMNHPDNTHDEPIEVLYEFYLSNFNSLSSEKKYEFPVYKFDFKKIAQLITAKQYEVICNFILSLERIYCYMLNSLKQTQKHKHKNTNT
jgi:hypothetical protein